MRILGYLVFGDVPDALTVTVAVVVLASGLYVWWRKRVTKRDI
jgi:drug/metabolite transporter (DMT)-like permease